MKKGLIIFGIIGIGVAGYLFYRKQIDRLMEMKYQVVNVKLNDIGLTNTVADISVRIDSTSTLEAEIRELDLDVYVNNAYVGKITETKSIIIPAKGYSIATVKIAVNPKVAAVNIAGVAMDLWKAKDAIITLKGKVKVKTAFITLPVPVDYTESVKYLMS